MPRALVPPLLLLAMAALAPCPALAQQPAMVTVEAGSYTRGGEQDADEFPAHRVVLTAPFALGVTEVSQGLFESVMGFNPSATQGRDWRGDVRGGTCASHGVDPALPVMCVTWEEAVDFCNRLSRREGLTPAYRQVDGAWVWELDADGFRLPTEAEWEWAARSELDGVSGPRCGYANVATAGAVKLSRSLEMIPTVKEIFDCDDGVPGLAAVDWLAKPPGPRGLRDLLGNVWEWTWDLHAAYPSEQVTDPQRAPVPTKGDRVLRGGSWANPPGDIRVRNRFEGPQDGRSYLVGFRVARSLPAKGAAEGAGDELARHLGATLAGQLAAIRREFDVAKTPEQVAAVWRRSMEVMPSVNNRLEEIYFAADPEGTMDPSVDLDWVNGALPGLLWTYGIEGLGITSNLESPPWHRKIGDSVGEADDRFLDLMEYAYGGPHPPHARPWPMWQMRNWDYGGCSGLGSGAVLEALRYVDKALAAGDLFEPEIRQVRHLALQAILVDDEYFPYCDGASFEPTSDAALRDEARGVLEEIRLTADEKAAIEARIPKIKGARFTGG
jgi:formylglycine-generating enzyme required for sulfatase activity